MATLPYNPLSAFLKERYGCKARRIPIDAGVTCPNRDGTKGVGGCTYCLETALVPDYAEGRGVREQLEEGLRRAKERAAGKAARKGGHGHGAADEDGARIVAPERYIAFFQINTNTYAPAAYLEEIFSIPLEYDDVAAIAVSTRPDCLDAEKAALLRRLKGKKELWLELGLQTANDSTLKEINRGHTVRDFEDAVRLAGAFGLDVCAHVIIGLPGETKDDYLNTARLLARLGVWGVKFHQLDVVKGTLLEKAFEAGELRPLSLDEYAEAVVESLELLPPSTIVHRLAGETKDELLAAPAFGGAAAGKHAVRNRVVRLMAERGTRQGALYRG